MYIQYPYYTKDLTLNLYELSIKLIMLGISTEEVYPVISVH